MRSDIIFGWLLLYTPPGLLAGALIAFGIIPAVLRFSAAKAPGRGKMTLPMKAGLTVLFTALFVAVMCGFSIYGIESTKNDYWKSRGDWESWRVPLAMPYELVMTGTMESAVIRAWQTRKPIVADIIRCLHQGNHVAGETGISRSKNDKTVQGWFLFNVITGMYTRYATHAAFQKACAEAGIRLTQPIPSVRDRWYTYWKIIEH